MIVTNAPKTPHNFSFYSISLGFVNNSKEIFQEILDNFLVANPGVVLNKSRNGASITITKFWSVLDRHTNGVPVQITNKSLQFVWFIPSLRCAPFRLLSDRQTEKM